MKKTIVLFTVIALIFSLFGCSDTVEERVSDNGDHIRYTDTPYGNDERQRLDLALPKGATGEVGLMLFIHGGGWSAGDKSGYVNELSEWSGTRGFAAAAINYRYASDEVHVEDIIYDITNALAKIKEVAAEHGINVTRVMLQGGSAGAHLSLLYAYKIGDDAPIKPVAIASYAGPTDLTDERYFVNNPLLSDIERMFSRLCGCDVEADRLDVIEGALLYASPVSYVKESSVPTLIFQGACDDVVPYTNAITLDELLSEYGVAHELILYPNSSHGLGDDPECAERANELLLEYANKYLKEA